MSEVLVQATGLVRDFRVRRPRSGLSGALIDLVRPVSDVVRAVDGVDLRLVSGSVLGIIGGNGAGKSTTIKCLAGILVPDAGTVRVCGLDPVRQRSRSVHHLGVVFGQRSGLWWDLPVRDSFDLLASVFSVPPAVAAERMAELAALLELGPLMGVRVRELSLGQRVRCDLAAALIHGPRVLLLDEPTIGLDVGVRRRVRDFVRRIAHERGVAVLLATHDSADIEAMCDRVVVLSRGRVVFEGTVPELADGQPSLEDAIAARLDQP